MALRRRSAGSPSCREPDDDCVVASEHQIDQGDNLKECRPKARSIKAEGHSGVSPLEQGCGWGYVSGVASLVKSAVARSIHAAPGDLFKAVLPGRIASVPQRRGGALEIDSATQAAPLQPSDGHGCNLRFPLGPEQGRCACSGRNIVEL